MTIWFLLCTSGKRSKPSVLTLESDSCQLASQQDADFPFGAYSQVNQTGPAHQTVHTFPAHRRPDLPCCADFADTRRQRMACPARMRCQCHCPSPLWFKWTYSGRRGDCATARDQSGDRGCGRHAGAGQNHQQYSITAGGAAVCSGSSALVRRWKTPCRDHQPRSPTLRTVGAEGPAGAAHRRSQSSSTPPGGQKSAVAQQSRRDQRHQHADREDLHERHRQTVHRVRVLDLERLHVSAQLR